MVMVFRKLKKGIHLILTHVRREKIEQKQECCKVLTGRDDENRLTELEYKCDQDLTVSNEKTKNESECKLEEDVDVSANKIANEKDIELVINPKFSKFITQRKWGKHRYLCYTCNDSKQGQIIRWLMTKGLPYIEMPNVFIDDETVNIMIEVNMENSKREDILYLLTKYKSSYSIYNIPIIQYLAASKIYKAREEFKLDFPKLTIPQQRMCKSITSTMKMLFELDSNAQLYEKVFKPILNLFYIGIDYNQNKECSYTFIPLSKIGDFDSIPNPFSNKDNLQKYESSILIQMKNEGVKISRWKNEVEMFSIINSVYPDAIYQYHTPWLGQQSLDVYVPSLNIAFEYQGIQHFKPIDFFGGQEALEDNRARDSRKSCLCKEHGVRLIYWRYDEPVNQIVLEEKLNSGMK